ncbi:unnamed protein product [Agarophyton chilense]|eukprot:gb/GEZJ01004408.1/.p1 GENE.gb/GEZJ01004408.1/~~gb/GEZJ01004408.1/.p1  ORF type:complete len:212 (-),score=39.38 gb/GEZJ01004408.1/:222-857(-)
MLRRLLQGTRLFQQVAEIRDAYRSLRLSQHRSALRTKRAAVRSRVLLEVHRARMNQVKYQMELVRSAARIRATRLVLDTLQKRRAMLEKLAESRGESLPPSGDEGARRFKQRLVNGVDGVVGEGQAAGLVRGAVRETVDGVVLRGEDDAEMGSEVVVSLAKEIGMSRDELERLIEQVEGDGEGSGLRESVLRGFCEQERRFGVERERRQAA